MNAYRDHIEPDPIRVGDTVQFNCDKLCNKPIMFVLDIIQQTHPLVKCFWYTKDENYCEEYFSSNLLVKI